MEEYLKKIWYDPRHPGSFAGPSKLYQVVKQEGKFNVGMGKIKKFLQNQDAYSLQKKVRRKGFKRRRVVVQGIDYQWEADLADVQNLSEYNDGINFLLVIVDVFSRYLWVRPLKDRKAKSVMDAFKDVFQGSRRPKALRTDKGSEFYNRLLQRYLKDQGIKIFYALNETKANFAERYIQTLKKRLYRYFTHLQKYKYSDILQDVVQSINDTPNRSLNGRTPASVTKANEEEVRLDAYLVRRRKATQVPQVKKSNKSKKRLPYTFKIGDQVRITHLRRPFQRDYDQTYTEEIFVIRDRWVSQGIPIYKLKDLTDDPIQGTFYASELQKVLKDDDTIWRIDKILRKRKVRGKEEVLVRWLGWPKKFDSWIPKGDIKET
ncbi:uncharacterized protein LOC133198230 [Saccostrea echinata]|uniref:uncharacterized protein LOC133198230 n=1 Tax=Saccostrea echinata TaxID=191078 RepID=UPI002A83C097|nr:uncharacterized protein LOC133198230 [Saccostrea echinata]